MSALDPFASPRPADSGEGWKAHRDGQIYTEIKIKPVRKRYSRTVMISIWGGVAVFGVAYWVIGAAIVLGAL